MTNSHKSKQSTVSFHSSPPTSMFTGVMTNWRSIMKCSNGFQNNIYNSDIFAGINMVVIDKLIGNFEKFCCSVPFSVSGSITPGGGQTSANMAEKKVLTGLLICNKFKLNYESIDS